MVRRSSRSESSKAKDTKDYKDSEEMDLRRVLRMLGSSTTDKDAAVERRRKGVEAGRIYSGEMLDGYLIIGLNEACVQRARKQGDKQPSFLIWDAIHEDTQEEMVLKGVNPALAAEKPELGMLLLNEFRVLSILEHKNIAKSFNLLRKGGMQYIPLEYLSFALEDVIGDQPTLEGLAFFAMESANAMQYLEKEGVVHGDIKLSQFRAGYDQTNPRYKTIKLIDFGGARHPKLVPTARIMYTPAYAAPEILSAAESKDAQRRIDAFTHEADMYSLGLLYSLIALTGKMRCDEISAVFYEPGKCAQKAVQAVYDHHVPYQFNRIIEAMVKERAEERIDANELMERLRAFNFHFGLGPRVETTVDLYTNEVIGKRVMRPELVPAAANARSGR
jgi:serine/threonine protein kinase